MPPRRRFPTYELYAEQLLPLDLGYALYEPDPGLGRQEVHVGDIGFVFDGRFRRIASVLEVGNGVTSALAERFHETERFSDIHKGVLSSKSVRNEGMEVELSGGDPLSGVSSGASLRFSCRSEKGATLIRKYRATDEKASFPIKLRQHFAKHLPSVFDFAKTNGFVENLQDIILVMRRIMTGDWATLTFNNQSRDASAAFNAQIATITAKGTLWGKWSEDFNFPARNGPPRQSAIADDQEPDFNQCVFIETCRFYDLPWYNRLITSIRVAQKKGLTEDHIDENPGGARSGESSGGSRRSSSHGDSSEDTDAVLDEQEVLTAYDVLAFWAFHFHPLKASNSTFDFICVEEEDVKRLLPESSTLESLAQKIQGFVPEEFSVVESDDCDMSLGLNPKAKVGKLQHHNYRGGKPEASSASRIGFTITRTPSPVYSSSGESDSEEGSSTVWEQGLSPQGLAQLRSTMPTKPTPTSMQSNTHPFLEADAYMRSGAPLCWDVRLSPSTATVRPTPDKYKPEGSPQPNKRLDIAELALPATYPPTTRMEVAIPQLPWKPISVTSKSERDGLVTFSDLVSSVHASLQTQMRKEEYSNYPMEMQERIARAFYLRCERVGQSRVEERLRRKFDRFSREDGEEAEKEQKAEEKNGLRRVDILLGATEFFGLAPDVQNDGSGRSLWVLTLAPPRS